MDDILFYMEEHNIRVIPELQELKQFLRCKGNSLREQGNLKYWNTGGLSVDWYNKKKKQKGGLNSSQP